MKICPVCGATVFDDMDVCYGCMHRFGEDSATDANNAHLGEMKKANKRANPEGNDALREKDNFGETGDSGDLCAFEDLGGPVASGRFEALEKSSDSSSPGGSDGLSNPDGSDDSSSNYPRGLSVEFPVETADRVDANKTNVGFLAESFASTPVEVSVKVFSDANSAARCMSWLLLPASSDRCPYRHQEACCRPR